MPAPLEGILETAIYVDDLDRAEGFYSNLLGLEMVARAGNRHVFFRCGPGILLIFNAEETVKPPHAGSLPVPPHGTTGKGHVCFRVAAENLDAMVSRLMSADVAIEADFRWPNGARSIYFRDPAGNSLECAEPALWNIS
ncbi:VOC family protein [Rhizobiaceae bacterium n13]|uniref:VOC family protein n=1 Tax=Ferirhizobium litorale TaxID=2927786 RepID=A0AAE3QFP1_9HYPH|nr:VOC family protein [Fererhizobium litorale]MDI7864752.1 VOC family protein [Fererhizobium litorale]MDI7924967.1 VOC family protein [Fererhizobium litorale]